MKKLIIGLVILASSCTINVGNMDKVKSDTVVVVISESEELVAPMAAVEAVEVEFE